MNGRTGVEADIEETAGRASRTRSGASGRQPPPAPPPDPPAAPGPHRESRIVRLFATLGTLVLGTMALHHGAAVIVPVVQALVIWIVLNALSSWLRRAPVIGRLLPGWGVLLLTSLVTLAVGMAVVRIALGSVGQVTAQAASFRQLGAALVDWIAVRFDLPGTELAERLLLGVPFEQMARYVIGATTSTISQFSIVAIYVAFMLADQQFLRPKFALLVPDPQRREELDHLLRRLVGAIYGYLQVMTLASIATSLLSYLILRLIGLESAGFWAAAIFFLNYIPTIGSIIGTVLPTAFVLAQFQSFWPPVLALAGVGTVQFVIGNIVIPRMFGDRLNVSLFVVLLSIFAFGMLWGITGMFIAMPVTAMLIIGLGHFEATRPIAIILSRNGDVDNPAAVGAL